MREANLDPESPTVRTAVFGQQVQDFLNGPIGDFLLRKAEKRLERLVETLKRINPDQRTDIVRAQAEIAHLERFEQWLGEAVQDGLTAMAIIDGEDLDA